MQNAISILLVEDSAFDAELLDLELREAGLHAVVLRIEQLAQLPTSISSFHPDVVISDWRLPGFSGLDALRAVRAHAPGTPFALLCGLYDDDAGTREAIALADLVLRKDALDEVAPALRKLLLPDPDSLVADDASSDA